jgi:hypothetical protein
MIAGIQMEEEVRITFMSTHYDKAHCQRITTSMLAIGSNPSGRRLEAVAMSWLDNQRHAVVQGTSKQDFMETYILFYAYQVIDVEETLEHLQMGSGRPFSPCCIGCRKEFGPHPVHMSVGVPEDLRPSITPVLGMCACITCLECVYSMPLEDDGRWRKCRGCGRDEAHEAGHLKYPVTLDGMTANTAKARRRREAGERV